jgi:hypothetical protein
MVFDKFMGEFNSLKNYSKIDGAFEKYKTPITLPESNLPAVELFREVPTLRFYNKNYLENLLISVLNF